MLFGLYTGSVSQWIPLTYYRNYHYDKIQGMLMGPRTTIPDLPQEIIDQIIDEVACSDGDSATQQALDALKSCSLVCRAFHSRARSHIFTTVNFKLDRFAQKRAGRLVQLMRKKDDRTPIIQSIRRFNLLFDFRNSDVIPKVFALTGMVKPFIRARSSFLRTLEAIGLRKHNINQLFDMMGSTALTHFTLGSRRNLVQWTGGRRPDIDNKLLRIIAQPSLQSLSLHNLMDLPELFISSAFRNPSLTEMRLSYLRFFRGQPLPLPGHEIQRSLSKIEKMELRFISYKALLAIIRTLEQKTSPSDLPTPHIRAPIYSRVFSSLRTLSVRIPKSIGEQEALWDIMQSAAPYLTTLKIDSHEHTDTLSLEPITLAPFKALKRLDFSLTVFGDNTAQELCLSNILSSATSPMLLESINLTFIISPESQGNLSAAFRPTVSWTLLDNPLSNPLFVNLASVIIKIETDLFDNSLHQSKEIEIKDTSELLPIVAASPSVDLRIYLSAIKGPQTLLSGSYFDS